MAGANTNDPHIIGLTGSFGSGCSYIAEHIIKNKEGYHWRSLSKDALGPLFQKETGKNPDTSPRRELQEFGDKIREKEGHGYFAEVIAKTIKKDPQKDGNGKWVIDSIRNPAEVRALRKAFSNNFFLFGVYAEKDKRWQRVETKYSGNRKAFDDDDENDTGEDNPTHGQRVGDCFYQADIVFKNNEPYATVGNEDFKKFAGGINQYINLVSHPRARQRPIKSKETIMAMAYALSQRSTCLKRKVGAIITDSLGNIISSGFNEVPGSEKPCEKKYQCCYRDQVCKDFFSDLKIKIPEAEGREDEFRAVFRRRFKILDYCRALHAEENAIVNLARNGRSVPLDQCILYSTTYPCRMCANKIVQSGIVNIVYIEPYPDPEAKSILSKAGVTCDFFEGVTYNAYSRLYGEEK